MSIKQGDTLSHYRLVEKIGEGGMGIVWKALDTRLGRDVALKILPEEFAGDPQRVARLEHEARNLAALKHPNIVTIHSVEEDKGERFITMELVEGDPLTQSIRAGGLPLEKIFDIAIPVTTALAAAHEKGIIHRDLKPGNLMVTAGGEVKVLDFGIAKLKPAPAASLGDARTETLTESGQLVGTFPYMSPEQAQAKPVDHRSDIFSLGVILYEMCTGSRPFRGDTAVELITGILRDSPTPVTNLRTELPGDLGRIVRRCLEKDPGRRYQSALDVRNELEDLKKELMLADTLRSRPVPAAPGAKRQRRWWIAAASLTAIALAVAAVALILGPPRDWFRGKLAPQIRSLAVLPLQSLTGDESQDHIVEGIHDALITELAKTGLKVISRTSVMRYKKTDKPVPQIAHELGVDALVEGSVLRIGKDVRVNVQLIHGTTDEHLWANSYDRGLPNTMAMLAEVTRAIAAQIKVTLTPQQKERLAGRRPVNPEAQDAAFKGHYYGSRFNFEKALEYFQKSIDIDPTFAPGYAGIAGARGAYYLLLGNRNVEAIRLGRAAAAKAIELDPDLGQAHAVLGSFSLYLDWDWPNAERELKRALELDPTRPAGFHGYADWLLVQGRVEESVEYVKRGRERDPLSPMAASVVPPHLIFARRYDEAIEECRKTSELFPELQGMHGTRRNALWFKGQFEEAIAESRLQWKSDDGLLKALDQGYAQAGPKGAVRAVAETMALRARTQSVSPLGIAGYYAMAGAIDPAMEWLEHAYNHREPFLAHLKADPSYDPLRSDPRFQDLLRRIGFP